MYVSNDVIVNGNTVSLVLSLNIVIQLTDLAEKQSFLLDHKAF